MKPNLHRRSFFLLLICFMFFGVFTQNAFAQWYWPVPEAQPQQNYWNTKWGVYLKLSYYEGWHYGIDIVKGYGAVIVAAADGTVVRSFSGDQYNSSGKCNYCGGGNVVVVKHVINGQTLYSHYAHLKDRNPNLSVGDPVVGGKTVIGWMGNTGSGAGGTTHLHFAIKTVTHGGCQPNDCTTDCCINTNPSWDDPNGITYMDSTYTPNCGNGISGNDQWGVHIDICGAPYTTYAKKPGGSGAWAPNGASTNWYAAARVNELTGVDVPIMDGQTWINSAESYGFTVSKEPNANPNWVHGHELPSKRLAIWKDHIRVIEGVNTQTQMILFSNGDGNSKYAANGYCGMEERSFTDFESDGRWFGDFLGYVFLDKPNPKGDLNEARGTDDGRIHIYGWAYDPSSPDTDLDLRIQVKTPRNDFREYIEKVNNYQRVDLDYTKKGFLLDIPTDLRGENIALTVEAEGTGTGKSLILGDGIKYITITADYPNKITLNQDSLDLRYGSSGGSYAYTLGNLYVSSYRPNDAINKKITWTSSDTSVAVVSSDGEVTPKSSGTATITAAVVGRTSVKAECHVTVSPWPEVLPASIELDKTNESVAVGSQFTLSATLSPSNADNKKITWSSSDTSVATVSNGVVTAVGEGSAVITAAANANSSVKAVCNVTVYQNADPSCDWVEKSFLPPNVNPDEWEIEVKNHYVRTGSTSPGNGWTQSDSSTRYVESDEPYVTYMNLGADTNTRKFIKKVWYHWCGHPQHRDWVELEQQTNYPHKHELDMDETSLEDRARYEDSNVTGVYQHELWWKTGQYAGNLAHCGNYGARWYEGWKYQNYTAVTENTWVRDSEWLSLDQLDSNATSVSYRFRLKNCDAVSYTVTFKVANGSWDDGTTADKTVTLDGIASDTLTLSEEQIPTAGTKPNTNYKTGKWGVTPSVNTQITGDTTYTYTYAKKDSLSSTVTFKVVNGAWDDETTADKTVTLSGYEGDELKMSAGDIPAVGTKPAENYSEGSWNTTPSTDTVITGNTTYTYTYKAKSEVTHTVTFKVVNGSWDDGTTADQTVTLTGYEGDSLKLTQSQIPAVGSKPNETYKIGTWDTTPDITTAITSNITYTYTYAVYENDNRVKLIVSSEEARPGEEVTVSLNIKNNPGIAGMILTISYDENRLIYKGFENSGISGWYGTGVDLIWEDISQNYDVNGEIIKLKFAVLQNAKKGDALVTVICNKISDNKELKYIPVIESGKVDVIIPGDLNGDGDVDIFDVIRLRRYLVKEPVELFANPDLNRDGDVDIFDVIRLRRFLVKEPVVIY
ncbi:MAG: Ig-like domain-containing protein [Anaerolineaceae bacterium]|nr:Ig-like domain-containing protein [Anaerolineaceae bacterium]